MKIPYLTIDLRGLAAGNATEVRRARAQLAKYFNGDMESMRRYYKWKAQAPVLAIIANA